MSTEAPLAARTSSVDLLKTPDGWVVRIEHDGEVSERDFTIEQHARSWADGQRIRVISLGPGEARPATDIS